MKSWLSLFVLLVLVCGCSSTLQKQVVREIAPPSKCSLDDLDGDGYLNYEDNCVWNPNLGQEDFDGDGIGDVCDLAPAIKGEDDWLDQVHRVHSNDWDGDGILNQEDNCPTMWGMNQSDIDGDGEGDICDCDRDGNNKLDFLFCPIPIGDPDYHERVMNYGRQFSGGNYR